MNKIYKNKFKRMNSGFDNKLNKDFGKIIICYFIIKIYIL